MNDDNDWFAPKRFGSGPGIPISWQGWALTIAFVIVTIGIALELRNNPVQLVAALIPPIVVFLVVSCRTTRGGCRWRWGKED